MLCLVMKMLWLIICSLFYRRVGIGENCMFDATQCSFPCPFGYYARDSKRFCPSKCECSVRGLYAGDIIFEERMLPAMLKRYGLLIGTVESISLFSSTTREQTHNWWDNGPVEGKHQIPYTLEYDFDEQMKPRLMQALSKVSSLTCVSFKPWQGEAHRAVFTMGEVCSSAIGKWPEAQKVTLSPRCQDLGSILHELTHLLGFEHEHNHPKRDDYVDVHESNIEAIKKISKNEKMTLSSYFGQMTEMFQRKKSEAKLSFMKLSKEKAYDLGAIYDVQSVMHLSGYAFSKNALLPTITIRKTGQPVIAQRSGFSVFDIQKINQLYHCPGSGAPLGYTAKPSAAASNNSSTNPAPDLASSSAASSQSTPGSGESAVDKSDGVVWSSGGYDVGPLGLIPNSDNSGQSGGQADANSEAPAKPGTSAAWGLWHSWSECVKTCGNGEMRKRLRYCHGGTAKQQCRGKHYQNGRCPDEEPCPMPLVDWNQWGDYGYCSKSCGGGLQIRKRTCPLQDKCQPGKPIVSRYCNTEVCSASLVATWQQWTTYGTCSKTCGGGKRYRNRLCLKSNRLSFGCAGQGAQITDCNTHKCALLTGGQDSSTTAAIFSYAKTTPPPLCESSSGAKYVWSFTDFDRDHRSDVMCGPISGDMKVAVSAGSSPPKNVTWEAMTGNCGPSSKHPGDFDGDGFPDVLCLNHEDRLLHVKLLRDGRLSREIEFSGAYCSGASESLLVLDTNGDGKADLLCAHPGRENYDLAPNVYVPY